MSLLVVGESMERLSNGYKQKAKAMHKGKEIEAEGLSST